MKLVKNNIYFFALFILFLLIGAALLCNIDQGDAILALSDQRTAFGNFFFIYFTKAGEEWAYLVVLLSTLFLIKPRNYKLLLYIPLLGGTVALISYFTKEYFRHPRPILYFERKGVLDEIITVAGVSLNGGLSSFPSGHTMSAFALYAFVAFIIPNKKMAGLFLFLAAFLVGISRIYLVQHFLEDVYLGAIIGVGIGIFWYYMKTGIERKWRRTE